MNFRLRQIVQVKNYYSKKKHYACFFKGIRIIKIGKRDKFVEVIEINNYRKGIRKIRENLKSVLEREGIVI